MLVALCGISIAQPALAAGGNGQDCSYVDEAARFGQAEVVSARLALRTSHAPRVVSFAARMRDVHTALNGQLGAIAGGQGFARPRQMDAPERREIAQLRALRGARFDRAYLQWQLHANERFLRDTNQEIRRGQNSYVRSFATSAVPIIDKHLFIDRHDLAALGMVRD